MVPKRPRSLGPLLAFASALSASLAFAADPEGLELEMDVMEAQSAPQERPLALGARGFMGVRAEGEEPVEPVFGGLALIALPVFERITVEGSVGIAKAPSSSAFFIGEAIAKFEFEREGELHPHLAIGPVLSVDISDEASVSGGGVFGVGLNHIFEPRVAWTVDLNYRLLAGRELSNIVSLAFGCLWEL